MSAAVVAPSGTDVATAVTAVGNGTYDGGDTYELVVRRLVLSEECLEVCGNRVGHGVPFRWLGCGERHERDISLHSQLYLCLFVNNLGATREKSNHV